MDDNLSRFVPNVYFEQIPIKNLVSNQDYQRSLSETNILKAAEDFDLFQINPVSRTSHITRYVPMGYTFYQSQYLSHTHLQNQLAFY